MIQGVIYGLLACALWGATYLLPVLLPTYTTLQIALARAVIMGLAAIVGLYVHRYFFFLVGKKDWWSAMKLTLFGNLIQPWFLFTSVQYAGVALAATFFGLVPVLVALVANERDRRKGKVYLTLKKLSLPLCLLFCGLVLANLEGLIGSFSGELNGLDFLVGCAFATCSTLMWTWYPIRNADWLLEHPKVSPIFFAEMQCIILFPLGAILYCIDWQVNSVSGFLGEAPALFCLLILFAGVFCSFGATALWNMMSQRVPTAVVGPMLVFETIFSVAFG